MDPSSPDKLSSIILSGWGIIPKTFFSLLKIPAIFFIDPLGLNDCSIFPASRAHGGIPEYSEASPSIIKINKGEKIGLVGKSGAGKSSILNLLLRFY